jgi:hypothetical protein
VYDNQNTHNVIGEGSVRDTKCVVKLFQLYQEFVQYTVFPFLLFTSGNSKFSYAVSKFIYQNTKLCSDKTILSA